jgi:hypothetical protein
MRKRTGMGPTANSSSYIFCLILLLIICMPSLIFASISQRLEEKFQIGRPQAHYIILLDTSGSMKLFFNQVLEAVQVLLKVLPPDDILTIYRFDDFPIRLCNDVVKKLGDPSNYLPKDVNRDPKSRTEIGETLEKALDDIETSKASIFFLFFLTDGKEEPRVGSKFYTHHEESWAALAMHGQKLAQQKEIWGYGLGLRRYTDVTLLAKVIPSERVEIITMRNPSELQGLIESLREKVRRRWIQSAVARELESGFLELVQVETPKVRHGRVKVSYVIRSTYTHLDIRPFSLSVNILPDMKVSFKTPISVPTRGKSQSFTVSFKLPHYSRWRFGKKRIVEKRKLIFQATPSFMDAEEIRNLGLEPNVKLKGFQTDISYSFLVGIPISFLIVLVLSVLLGSYQILKWMRLPPPEVFGIVSACGSPPVDLGREHRKVITIGGTGQDIFFPCLTGAFKIEVQREGSFDILLLQPIQGNIQLRGRTLSPYAREEIQGDRIVVNVNGVDVTLTFVSPRRVPQRSYVKMLVFVIFLIALNFIIWKVGP